MIRRIVQTARAHTLIKNNSTTRAPAQNPATIYPMRCPGGLYVPLEETSSLSCSAHKLAASKGLPLLASAHGEQSKIYIQAKEALELFSALPQSTDSYLSHTGPDDTVYDEQVHGQLPYGTDMNGSGPAYIWHKPGRTVSSSASLNVEHDCPTPTDAGWDIISEIHKRSASLDKVLALVGCSMATDNWAAGASSIAKKSQSVIFEPANNTANFDQAASFIVMIPDGFADKDGDPGAIGSARSFESVASAKHWCSAKAFSAWKILSATIVVNDALKLPGDTHMDAASAAIASREARELKAFFERADLDTLRERVAELEAAQGIKPPQKKGFEHSTAHP